MPFLKIPPFVSRRVVTVYPYNETKKLGGGDGGDNGGVGGTGGEASRKPSSHHNSHCKRRQDSNLFSKWTHTYISQLLRRGMKKQLTPDDVPEIEYNI